MWYIKYASMFVNREWETCREIPLFNWNTAFLHLDIVQFVTVADDLSSIEMIDIFLKSMQVKLTLNIFKILNAKVTFPLLTITALFLPPKHSIERCF